jgi:tRNA (mo5U34)-methyltransferase
VLEYPSPRALIWALKNLGFVHVRKLHPPHGAYQQLATGKRIMIEARF